MKKSTHRINLYLEIESLEVIDAFAKATDRTRTYVVQELLRPFLPALQKRINEEHKTVFEKWALEADLSERLD